MAPKAASKAVNNVPKLSVLDATFPAWTEIPAEKESNEKYEDPAGTMLPPEAQTFLDTWKRPEELVQNMPDVPMLRLKPAHNADGKEGKAAKGTPAVLNRDHEGRIFGGHKSFDWLSKAFDAVISAQKCLPATAYLWELIYPKDKDGMPMKTTSGKYRVKLFVMGEWRAVTIDDRIPVDLFGQFLVVGVRPLQLWPMLLSKAVLKVMAAQRILHLALPHQVTAFRLLTGWPQEDLLDPLGGTPLAGGFLFDRMEDAVRGNGDTDERHNVATTCLIQRTLPETPPPRIIVLVGPSAVGRSKLMKRLVQEFPDKLGLTISHTSRLPYEHEEHGKDYFFISKAEFRAEIAEGTFLEHAAVSGIHDTYHYGTSIACVREVAATGRLCLMGLDEQGVAALRANHRIDGLYLFVAPPSMEVLEQRVRARLREADSTIAKRVAWAREETAAAGKPKAFDHIVENTDFDTVYYALKEAISTLSPIIRNRLRGLPAYVLDYSDLIPPNLVEKPFLKPVIVAGPATGERLALMEELVREFPDVFAFPRLTTTRQANELDLHRVTPAEQLARKEEAMAKAKRRTTSGGAHLSGVTPPAALAGGMHEEEEEEEPALKVPPSSPYADSTVLTPEQFDEAVQSGELLEYHSDLFKHPMATHRTGVSESAIKEVIMAGKLPCWKWSTRVWP